MRKMLVPAMMLVAATFSSAEAQQPPPPKAKPPAGEILLVNLPKDWQPQQVAKTGKVEITRLLPPGQSEANWTEMMTIQIHPGTDGNPRAFIDGVLRFARDNCEAVGASPINETTVNNYPFGAASVTCTKGRASGMGSIVMVQSIRGKEALYVVQRQWRGKPFAKDQPPPMPAEIAQQWRDFRVGLCDTRGNEHPCPGK